jgi:hypothetical protein
MEFLTWAELLKRELAKHGEQGGHLKGCNMGTLKLMSCIGTHWKREERELVAWSSKREYYSTTVDGIVIVTSKERE